MHDPLRAAGRSLSIERGGRVGFASLPGNFRVFVLVVGIACSTARLLHIGADHGDDRVIRDTPLTRAVIIENVTKPKLALLHPSLPKEPLAGKEVRKACKY
jgi:hypothetical protein